jgi:excinuclease ABC subunit B
MDFKLVSNYKPQGDQGKAIETLTRGVFDREQHQVLLGVTGSGKTYTMAKVIEAANRPALVMAHNKTLAALLPAECGRVFRLLLRLLPARGLRARSRSLHRKRGHYQR